MTIDYYSSLFATIRTIRDYSHYSYYSGLFAIRYSRLFAIRYSGFPDTPPPFATIHHYIRLFSRLFATIRQHSRLFATIRDCSPLFALFESIRTIRTIPYSLFATIRYSRLFGFSRYPKVSYISLCHKAHKATRKFGVYTHRRERLRDQSTLSKNRTQRPQCAPKLRPLDPGGFKR